MAINVEAVFCLLFFNIYLCVVPRNLSVLFDVFRSYSSADLDGHTDKEQDKDVNKVYCVQEP